MAFSIIHLLFLAVFAVGGIALVILLVRAIGRGK